MTHPRVAIDSGFVSPKLARLHRQLSSEGIESLKTRGDAFEGLEPIRFCIVPWLRSPKGVIDHGSLGGYGPQQWGRTLVPDLASPSSDCFARNIALNVLEVHPKQRLAFPKGVWGERLSPALFLRVSPGPHAVSRAPLWEKIASRLEDMLKWLRDHSDLSIIANLANGVVVGCGDGRSAVVYSNTLTNRNHASASLERTQEPSCNADSQARAASNADSCSP